MVDVTFLLLTWNRRHFIHSVLHNILQNKFPFKFIVIDNGSTDGTREYLLEHKDKIDELILNKQNVGIKTINEGIKLSEGSYITLNADDHIFPPEWVETMYKASEDVRCNISNFGYVSSAIHYAIPAKGSMQYLLAHTLPYKHWFNNPLIRIDRWEGTLERKTCLRPIKIGKTIYHDAHAVGGGGTFIPRSTFKKLGLFRSYGLRGLFDGEFRGRCKQYGLRVGYITNTAFLHAKEAFLNPERYEEGYKSIKPTLEQKAQLERDWEENRDSAKKRIPPPSVPKLNGDC